MMSTEVVSPENRAGSSRWLALQGDALLLVAVLAWALNFSVVKSVVGEGESVRFTFLAVRFWIAAICFAPFVWVCRKGWADNVSLNIRSGVIVGLVLSVAYALQVAALQTAGPGRVAFFTAASLVLVPLGYRIFVRSAIPWHVVVGIGVTIAGVCALTFDGSVGRSVGDAYAVASTVGFAADVILVDRYSKCTHPVAFTAVICATIAVACSVIALVCEPMAVTSSNVLRFWVSATFAGIVATALAFYVQTLGQRTTDALHAALIFATEPMFAALAGYFWHGEEFTALAVAGCIAITCGTVFVELFQVMKKSQVRGVNCSLTIEDGVADQTANRSPNVEARRTSSEVRMRQ